MLAYLRIRGLALLDDVTLEFGAGLNVLTGETGAGKSIIVDALTLLRGARARADLVRAGEDSARVDAQFELGEDLRNRVAPLLTEHGLPDQELAALVVQRVVPRSGRGRILVQAELTTSSVLGELGEQLIEICSQHEHHSLTRVSRHLELLDAFGRLDEGVERYLSAYTEYKRGLKALEELKARAADRLSRADYLRFQCEELERVMPGNGEHAALKGKLELLHHAQRWAEFSREAHDVLYEADDAVLTRLGKLEDRARRGQAQSPRLGAIAEQLGTARAALEEAEYEVERLAAELEVEPGELERSEERLHELGMLIRKHGAVEDWTAHLGTLQRELAELDHAEETLARSEVTVEQARMAAVEQALGLRQARGQAARALTHALEQELRMLHLPSARMEARLEALPETELGPRGLDRVELMFSANPGEPLSGLTRVASGGELSRVLLALKSVLSTGGGVATYVFDEVDAGVAGKVAIAIGQRLRRAARQSQVLCITHLPQIAAFADSHYRVDKRTRQGRTTTRVLRLSAEERVEELGRMLGGARVTPSAREHARQLLKEAAEPAADTPGAREHSSVRSRSGGT
jgi:DNA repair protein RecN (Recombination protein N)